MIKFSEFHEIRILVDELALLPAFVQLNEDEIPDYNQFWRAGAAAGTFGKTVAGSVGNALVSPLKGLWNAGKRMYLGRRGYNDNLSRNELKQAKETMARALMSLEPQERDQEIEKFKAVLSQLKGQDRDSWARLSSLDKWMGGFKGGIDYKALAK